MKKLLFIMVSLLFTFPAFAGEYETALTQNKNILLYLYSSNCGYCVKFDPIYNKLSKTFSNKFNFIKVSADTAYGKQLMHKFGARFVPYVAITNKKTQENAFIVPTCLTTLACTERVLKEY